MAERYCRERRFVVVNRLPRRAVMTAVVIVVATGAVSGAGTAMGVTVMIEADAMVGVDVTEAVIVIVRRGLSSAQARVGWIPRRLCCRV
jgi:hypothetical protein